LQVITRSVGDNLIVMLRQFGLQQSQLVRWSAANGFLFCRRMSAEGVTREPGRRSAACSRYTTPPLDMWRLRRDTTSSPSGNTTPRPRSLSCWTYLWTIRPGLRPAVRRVSSLRCGPRRNTNRVGLLVRVRASGIWSPTRACAPRFCCLTTGFLAHSTSPTPRWVVTRATQQGSAWPRTQPQGWGWGWGLWMAAREQGRGRGRGGPGCCGWTTSRSCRRWGVGAAQRATCMPSWGRWGGRGRVRRSGWVFVVCQSGGGSQPWPTCCCMRASTPTLSLAAPPPGPRPAARSTPARRKGS